RLVLALTTVVGVAAAELGTFFCFNSPLATTGVLTSILVLLPLAWVATAWMGARGAFLVGVTSLGCIPTALIVGTWEARGFTSSPTSDFEDFSLLVLLVGGFASAAAFAIRRTRTALARTLCSTTRFAFLGALAVSAVLLAGALHRGGPTRVIVAGAVGIVLAIGLGIAARRARATHEGLASGVSGLHRGAGWLQLDDGGPPVHRPELAGSPERPVVVRGRTAIASQGYRGTPNADGDLAITFGTAESIRNAGASRAASHHAIGVAVLAFSSLSLVTLPLVGVSPF
ncbi:MAG: hypothetical protein JWO86_4594, partial [Myxococcaceae bacterium]|nr:hypothetical protein [Myxococcaceae bacterium]